MKIILLRHGRTDLNEQGRHMGQVLDDPINEVGRAQVEGRIAELKALEPDAIISSPLLRAVQSAAIVGEHLGLEVELDERVMEIDMGSISGLTNVEAAAMLDKTPEEFRNAYRAGDYDYTALGGESAKRVVARAESFLSDLARKSAQSVVVVCHGGLMRTLYKIITGELYPIDKLLPNAGFIVLDYGGPS